MPPGLFAHVYGLGARHFEEVDLIGYVENGDIGEKLMQAFGDERRVAEGVEAIALKDLIQEEASVCAL